ncbi:hypothetical protein PFISCL1PPCAC_9151 [Pristionchus fissidentatus]|uniref:Uncharacterized protein n=1 Tax=Pristionchus fissidentatus TaxID=1538716 RepID=A0AAV5VEI4_9BILA|nr:hypothetical protein PFISCL1PPCAC_9151 [Pristionchus fissidentatus]
MDEDLTARLTCISDRLLADVTHVPTVDPKQEAKDAAERNEQNAAAAERARIAAAEAAERVAVAAAEEAAAEAAAAAIAAAALAPTISRFFSDSNLRMIAKLTTRCVTVYAIAVFIFIFICIWARIPSDSRAGLYTQYIAFYAMLYSIEIFFSLFLLIKVADPGAYSAIITYFGREEARNVFKGRFFYERQDMLVSIIFKNWRLIEIDSVRVEKLPKWKKNNFWKPPRWKAYHPFSRRVRGSCENERETLSNLNNFSFLFSFWRLDHAME